MVALARATPVEVHGSRARDLKVTAGNAAEAAANYGAAVKALS